jgi:tetratricopeptide (TPR) repeat protein
MADADEIRVYLASYPDDHEQRWRLARKLYEQRDYALALAELLRLKAAWPDHVPLQRYLGATHYRLGQFSEAATVLEIAVSRKPGDVLLLEQLAKTYEGAGRRHRAIDTWKLVLKFEASPRALEALERLGITEPTPPPGALASTLQELSTHGDDTLMNCPNCGEPNDMFSERCWRCHGDFAVAPTHEPPREDAPRPSRRATPLLLLAILLAAVAIAVAVYQWLF